MKKPLPIKTIAISSTAGFLVALALAITIFILAPHTNKPENNGSNAAKTAADIRQPSYFPAVNAISPSVVSIQAQINSIPPAKTNPLLFDPAISPFLLTPDEKTKVSKGSGVIIHHSGIIVTNHHVIKSAQSIHVYLADGSRFEATLLGTDEDTDLAVLDIPGNTHPAVTVNFDTLRVGDIVLAVGNPYGVGQTVTQGIISGLGREGLGLATYEEFIQTDAAINPGNSGGALVDFEGRLIGINTAIFSKNGGYQGIGFAIPSSMVFSVAKQIIRYGKVTRGYLGVSMHQLTDEEAEFFNLSDTNGLLVTSVTADGPAHQAGIRPGDVIISINGQNLAKSTDALREVAKLMPGTTAQVELYNQGTTRIVHTLIGKKPITP
ncbi:peptidase S1 and S6, chymotrypsin/Hap [Oleiphilus messinensis]|uniref:Peptidase S1 and S6, chymotrypsin/Hap n=1 Tax=Oleiphilus messinensis TaxID=141451 RepID=A0A1Y0I6D1_9GAMM|nr:trypsin-like peptidase domain-containing protein [Oleiphilus messinensis]ARU55981.1 peptidase S1 and S6, chymotrypsin/Hap [Oleiphilus messinensis]